MKITKLVTFICILHLFFSCTKNDDKITFNIVQLNDVYEIAPIQGGAFGGMSRVATVHQELLKENKNTLLVMAGDFLNPSLLGTIKVDGERVRGKQMVDVMNAMNFDVVCFGNHEFDLSKEDLQKRLNESNFPWIAANVRLKTDDKTIPFFKEIDGKQQPLQDYFIKEMTDADGTKIKVGFISVCIDSNPVDYVEYGNMFVKARASYNQIKDSVDVVLGLTHVKLANDKRIAKLIPEIPLILGGHEHTNKYEKVGEVLITKADANAKTVYIHNITFDRKTKKTTITSTLQEINNQITDFEPVKKVIDKWQNILNQQIKEIIENPNEIVFQTNIPLDGRDTQIRSEQTNLGTTITAAMSYAFDNQVDAALVNGGSIRIDDELVGNIAAIDIFRVLPFGGGIYKVKISGRLLKRVLDYGKIAAGTGAYLQRHQADFVNNEWLIKGEKINPTKKYTVVFSDYLLKGFDIPFLTEDHKEVYEVYKPNPEELGYDIRKAVIYYLKTKQ